MGRRRPGIERFEIGVAGLPESFDGFRIALISDVHAGAHMGAARMEEIVGVVDALMADLVVVAGDMVDGAATATDVREFVGAFGGVRGRHGAIAVPGNHDHVAGIDGVLEALRGSGLTALRGTCHTIEGRDGSLSLLGLDDPGLPAFDPPQDAAVAALIARAPRGAVPILVSHRPGAFDAACAHGIPLTLSGHTHGGQVGLPWRDLTPVRLATPYVRGHYRRGDSNLIVSSGVGTGQVPIRLGVPSSIAVVTLRRVGPDSRRLT